MGSELRSHTSNEREQVTDRGDKGVRVHVQVYTVTSERSLALFLVSALEFLAPM